MKPISLISFFGQYFKSLAFLKNIGVLFIAWGVPLVALALLFIPEKNALKDWDQHLSPWLMLLTFIACAAGLPTLFLRIFREIKNLVTLPQTSNRWIIPLLFAILLISSSTLALTHIAPSHRVQSDESIFLATAQNIYHNGLAGTCDEGFFDVDQHLDCLSTATSFKTKILSFFYVIGMPFFGKDLRWIFHFQFALYVLMGIAGFIALQLWFKRPFLSLSTMALLLYTPTLLFQYRSASVEPLYIVLAFWALIQLYFLHQDTPSKIFEWLSFAGTLGMLAQTRQESLFCLGAFLIFSLPRLLKSPKSTVLFYHSLFVFMLPVFFLILSYRGYNFQGGEFEAHGINNLIQHIQINFGEMTKPLGANGLLQNPFLAWFTWLALWGMILLVLQGLVNSTALACTCFLALYHLQSAAIFENVSGDFTIHINQRYALVILPTMAFLGGWLLQSLIDALMRLYETKNPWIRQAVPSVIAIAIIAWATWKHIPSFEDNIMYNRNHLTTEERTIHHWMKDHPSRKLWVYDRPWHFIGYGESALSYQRWQGLGPQRQKELSDDYQKEIYYVRGLRCYDKKSYHRKAVENRAPQWCSDFEHKHSLIRVLDTNVTNSYPLQISRIVVGEDPQARKPYQKIDYRTTADSVYLSPIFNSKWKGQNILYLNDQVYSKDSLSFPLSLPLTSGLNRIRWDFISLEETTHWLIELYAHRENDLSLGALQPKAQQQSWGQLGFNHTVSQNPIRVAGQTFERGLGTHAYSYLQFEIPKGFKTFEFGMGLDDEDTGGDGVIFKVRGDGRELYQSPLIEPRNRQWHQINIEGIQILELIVDSLSNKDYDHADWIEPTLVK